MSIRIEDATKDDFMTLSLKELRGLIKKKDLKNAIPGFSTAKKPDIVKRLVKYFTCKKVQKEKKKNEGVGGLFDDNKDTGPKKKKGCSKCGECERQLTPQEKAVEIADRRVEEAEQMRLYREARERGEVAPIITPIDRGEDRGGGRGRGRPQRPTEIIEEFDLDDDADIPPPSMIPTQPEQPEQPEQKARKEKELTGTTLKDLIKSAVTAGIIAHQGIKGARAERAERIGDIDIGGGGDFPDIPPEFHEEARQTRQEMLRRFNEQVSNPTGISTRQQAMQKLEDLEKAQALRRQQQQTLINDRLRESLIPDEEAVGIGFGARPTKTLTPRQIELDSLEALEEIKRFEQSQSSIGGVGVGRPLPFSEASFGGSLGDPTELTSIGGVGVGRPLPFSEASFGGGSLRAPTVGSLIEPDRAIEQLKTFLESIPEIEEGGTELDLTPAQIAQREGQLRGGRMSAISRRRIAENRRAIEEQKQILKQTVTDTSFKTQQQKDRFISNLARDIVAGTITPESFQIEKPEPSPEAFEVKGIRGKGVGKATRTILQEAEPAKLSPALARAEARRLKKLAKEESKINKQLEKVKLQAEKEREAILKRNKKIMEQSKKRKKPPIPPRPKKK